MLFLAFLSIFFYFVNSKAAAFGAKECPRGWLQYEENCYFKQPDLLSFEEAKKSCKRRNAEIFSSDDSFEFDAVRSLFSDYYFTWVHAEVVEELEWLYEPFDETLNGKSSVSECIACYSTPNRRYNYYYPCISRFYSICEKPLKTFRQWVN